MAIPDGAACYFCLEEDADDEGKPLVRDCSCRGESGFAHFSCPCLTKYAEQNAERLRGYRLLSHGNLATIVSNRFRINCR